MANYIDKAMWWDTLGKQDWYLRLTNDFKRLENLAKQHEGEPDYKQIKGEAYALVEQAVRENHIPLGSHGEDFDSERQPIDTIVIHHTKNKPGMTLERLNAMQLLRIYGSYYANPTSDQHFLRDKPVWSGHFFEERQVFWGYHWLIRTDGTVQRILSDTYIGWHAGNWDINTRSIGICIDDDLTDKEPNESVIKAIASLIQTQYQHIQAVNIIGHNDASNRTVCPGNLFHSQWQQKIINTIFDTHI